MQIGRFYILDLADGKKFWIEKEGGEGMKCDVSKLEEAIAEFFEREF